MTRYFMRDTPLYQMEQLMMTPPHFRPRGHGLYIARPAHRFMDTDCRWCTEFEKRSSCSLAECICLEERIAAGSLALTAFVQECFCPYLSRKLQKRLQVHLAEHRLCFFMRENHRKRWYHWRERYYRMTNRNKAALFLLTAYDDIWSRVIWHFDEYGFDFSSVSLSGIQLELYSVYQAAKGIAVGSRNITIDDLASPELVTDEAFQLIICALLLAKYGDAILNLE